MYEGISTIGSLAIDAGDALTIAEDATLTVGPVLNSGNLRIVGHDSNFSPGLRVSGMLINASGGLLSLDNGRFASYHPFRNKLFLNQSTTEGYGQIADLIIQNDGLIDANVTGKYLSVGGPQLAPHFHRNQGTMRATNGGILNFSGWRILNHSDGQQAGTIEAWGDSTVLIDNTTITGGRITTSTEGGVEEGQIQFREKISLDGVELDADASFISNVNFWPVLSESTFVNKKTLSLDGGSLQIKGTNVLSGGGVFKLSDDAIVHAYKDTGGGSSDQPTPIFVNVDNTVLVPQNSSATFSEEVFVENRGTFEANGPNAQLTLESRDLRTGQGKWINEGVIRAVNGGKIVFAYPTSGEHVFSTMEDHKIQNYKVDELGNVVAGKIQAGAGSEVHLAAVSGGIVQADEGGLIRVKNRGYLGANDTPTDLHLLGRIEADDITLGGTIRNDGQLVVSGTISHTNSPNGGTYSAPPLRLIGNGELQLDNFNSLLRVKKNSTFLNGPDHAIIGRGSIRNLGLFTNEGRIEANGNYLTAEDLSIYHNGPAFLFRNLGELISSSNAHLNLAGLSYWTNKGLIESRDTSQINVDFAGLLTNRGTIRVAVGAKAKFNGDLSNSGNQLINANGAITDINGSLWVIDSKLVNEEGGVVQGDGQVVLQFNSSENRRLINHGTLAPGDTIGQLTILGDFEQSTTGDLEIELGGTALNEFDSLSARSADLAGLLEVSLVDLGDGEFTPQLGDSFEIISLLTNGSVTGEFDTFSLPALATDLLWGIQYHPTSVVLEILAPLQADLDQDGDVDGSDFLAIQRTDPSLLSQWQAEYGSRVISSPAASQAVPEPTTLALLFPLLVLASLRHNRLQKTAAHERRQRLPTSSTQA